MSTLIVDLNQRFIRSRHALREQDLADYWQKHKLRWWTKALRQNPSYQEQERAIANWLDGQTFDRILEIGPGTGRITRLLVPINRLSLTLIETNEAFVDRLITAFPGTILMIKNAITYPWHQHLPFDLIVAIEVLVHIPDITAFLRKTYRALAPKGQAIVSITPLSWYQNNFKRPTVIHRGIDRQEFEAFVSSLFEINHIHVTSSGQHITYWLEKRKNRGALTEPL